MDAKTVRAIRYFCYTVGTVALLWLLAALLLGFAFLKTVATGDNGPTFGKGGTTGSTLPADGICSADQIDVDPDC